MSRNPFVSVLSAALAFASTSASAHETSLSATTADLQPATTVQCEGGLDSGQAFACLIDDGGATRSRATAALSSAGAKWSPDPAGSAGILTGVVLANGSRALLGDVALTKATDVGHDMLYVDAAVLIPANSAAPGSYRSAPITLTITE